MRLLSKISGKNGSTGWVSWWDRDADWTQQFGGINYRNSEVRCTVCDEGLLSCLRSLLRSQSGVATPGGMKLQA